MNWKLVRSALMLFVIFIAFTYIHRMEKCSCVGRDLVERLELVEKIILGLVVLKLGNTLFGSEFRISEITPSGLRYIIMTSIIGLFGYMTYLVYLYSLDAVNCKCAEQREKYALYAQALYYAAIFTMVLVSLIMMKLR